MRKKLPSILVPAGLLIAVFILVFLVNKFTVKKAGLLVETSPTATVYVNGESIGKTPLDISLKPGEISLQLVPDSFETPLSAYETRLKLSAGVKSVVLREFASDNENSSGAVISFEKSLVEEGSVAVVSYPETAQVFVDGTTKGFTPLRVDDVSGEIKIKTSIPGYHDKEISVTPKKGYLLTASIDLSKDANYSAVLPEKTEKQPEENEKKEEREETKKASIKILPTPVGYLKVRQEPVNGDELARVDSGKEYTYLEKDSETGWYKIEYEDEKTGWVSDDYVEEVNIDSEIET